MIQAKIVADSLNPQGNRITTMQVTFPRFILAELNTHRMFSRNSASSRAIPFEKMLKSVEENPFIPIAWQKDHKGMQGSEYIEDNLAKSLLEKDWLIARDNAIASAKSLNEGQDITTSMFDTKEFKQNSKLTKQLCNRLLEPFMWHTVLITATEWENFFYLRCPKYVTPVGGKNEDGTDWIYRSRKDVMEGHSNEDNLKIMSEFTEIDWLKLNQGQAEIHMMALAEAIWDAYNESTPNQLQAGEWHIPFQEKFTYESNGAWDKFCNTVRPESQKTDLWEDVEDLAIKVSTAMCARVSYTVVGEEGKEPNYENDIKLHDRLATSGHWSPFEHCAKAMKDINDGDRGISGNFKGFIQYRKMFNNENITL
jgi:hypothetical protein